MTALYVIGGILALGTLFCAYLLYSQMRKEGERDWLMRITNKKGIPD